LGIAGALFGLCALAGLSLGIWICVTTIRGALARHEFGFGVAAGALFGGACACYLGTILLCTVVFLGLVVLAPLSVIARAPASIPALIAYGSTDLLAEYFIETRAKTEPIAPDGDMAHACRLYTFSSG